MHLGRRLLHSYKLRTRLTTAIAGAYDYVYRIDTKPDTHTPPLDTEQVGYYPLDYPAIAAILAALRPRPQDVAYDLGCGKGRVICMLARERLRRVVGVEIDPTLASIAQRNIRRLSKARSPASVFSADAATVDLVEATIIVLYNPFGNATLGRVLTHLQQGLVSSPRFLRVVYAHPVHADLLNRTRWLAPAMTLTVPFQTTMRMQVMVWDNRAAPAGT